MISGLGARRIISSTKLLGSCRAWAIMVSNSLSWGFGGELAHQQQEHHLGKAEGLVLAVGFDDVLDADAAVVEVAGGGHTLAVLDGIALDRADLRDAQQHAGAVSICGGRA